MDLENKIFLKESPKKNRKLKRLILKSKLLQSKLFGQKKQINNCPKKRFWPNVYKHLKKIKKIE